MKKLLREDTISGIFCGLSIILFALLFCLSISSTWVNEWNLKDEFLFCQQDSILRNLLWLGLLLAFCSVLYHLGQKWRVNINTDLLAVFVSVLAGLGSIYWVISANTAPGGDQHALCYFAEAFTKGDYSSLEKGGYLNVYSHQLGLFSLVRLLFGVFGVGNYRAFQYFNALLIPLLIYAGFRIVKIFSEGSRGVELCYLALMLLCVPLYCYVPFVYGEIGSVALVMIGTWMFLECLEQFSWGKLGLMAVALGLAVQFRKNSLIFVVAIVLVVVVKLLQVLLQEKTVKSIKADMQGTVSDLCAVTRQASPAMENGRIKQVESVMQRKAIGQYIVVLCGILAGVILCQKLVDISYASLIPEDSPASPAIMYIAMGVNDDKINAGWHNNYDISGFAACDYDVELASEDAWGRLRDFADKCLENPGYGVDFYYRKISAQWNAPMYQSLVMNNNLAGEQGKLGASMYFGKLREVAEDTMNIYQLVIYGAVLALLIMNYKKWYMIERYILLIAVFGGFLFSILWEAKTRYVFPYFVVMLPYAAIGICQCVGLVNRRINGLVKRNDEYKEDKRKEVA